MSKLLGFLMCFLIISVTYLNAEEFKATGNIFPFPQKVHDSYQSVTPRAGALKLSYDTTNAGIATGMERLQAAFERFTINNPADSGVSLEVTLGLLSDPLVSDALKAINSPVAVGDIPPQGYVLRYKLDGDHLQIVAAAADEKGAFYASASLRQLFKSEDQQVLFRIANIDDYPVWLNRVASDYCAIFDYVEIAEHKFSSYGFQWRADFRKFQPESPTYYSWGGKVIGTVDELMKVAQEQKKLGIVDMMLGIHIYYSTPYFDITNPDDINELVKQCEYAFDHGFTTIYIGADDHTKVGEGGYVCHYDSEIQRFDNSVGRAHGYLMKELYDKLSASRPGIKLAFVPAPYSLYDHDVFANEANQKYMLDYSENAPQEVPVIWTGTGVYTTKLTKDDYQNFIKYLPHQPDLILWDNLEELFTPMPVFNADFYRDYVTDSGGEFFINAHTVSFNWSMNFADTINAYLWNPDNFDIEEVSKEVFARRYGSEYVDDLWNMTMLFEEIRQARRNFDKPEVKRLLNEALLFSDNLSEERLPKLLYPHNLRGHIEERLKELSDDLITINIPKLDASTLQLNGEATEKIWEQAAKIDSVRLHYSSYYLPQDKLRLFHDNNALYISGVMEFQPNRPRPEAGEKFGKAGDSVAVFLSPGGAEQLEVHFDAAGNYELRKRESRHKDYDLPIEIITKISDDQKYWNFELKIPYETLKEVFGTTPQELNKWRGNYMRSFFEGYNGLTSDHYQSCFYFE